MAGLYIHIPFCTQKCIYCDFMSGTNISLRGKYISALKSEMKGYVGFFDEDPIKTLYFGGGTPSLLTIEELSEICVAASEVWNLDEVEEFTIECNPDDISPDYISRLHGMQVAVCGGKEFAARLSIGIQSFDDGELKWLNRRHTAAQALEAVAMAKEAGYVNISIDLMFALPVQTMCSLVSTLDAATRLGVQHVSAYSLMFEPDSKITRLMAMERLKPLDDDLAADMYETLSRKLFEAGYEQYEISNYAIPGFESKHNSGYWHGVRYLGLGASAHSFDGTIRWKNVAHTLKYIDDPMNVEKEITTEDERFNELVFTALRTREGLKLDDVRRNFGDSRCDNLLRQAGRFVDSGHARIEDGRLSLTHEGIYISDAIMSEFMIV